MRNRIIVEHGKHGDSIYDATTDEQFAAASVAILKQRLDYYICKPEDPRDRMHESWSTLKPEHFEWAAKTVPEGLDAGMAKDLQDKINKAKRTVAHYVGQYEAELEEYNEVKRIVEENDRSMVEVGRRTPARLKPVAWIILQNRSDEYEQVELDYPIDAS